MGAEQIGTALAMVIAAAFALRIIVPKSKPKEKHFKCGRCGTVAPHNSRTIEAWRNKRTRFFCHPCHAKWLRENPQTAVNRTNSSPSGCLGAAALLAILPAAVIVITKMYT
jgi:transposase-like protein